MNPLARTLHRHRIVIAQLCCDPKHCPETLRLYQEEADALSVALAVAQLTQADGVG